MPSALLLFCNASRNIETCLIPPRLFNTDLSFPLPLPEITTLFSLAYEYTIKRANCHLFFLPHSCTSNLPRLRLWWYSPNQELSMAPHCLLFSLLGLTLSRNWLPIFLTAWVLQTALSKLYSPLRLKYLCPIHTSKIPASLPFLTLLLSYPLHPHIYHLSPYIWSNCGWLRIQEEITGFLKSRKDKMPGNERQAIFINARR